MAEAIDSLSNAAPVKITGGDETEIADVVDTETGKRLLVDALLKSGELVPTITNKLRVRYNIGNILLPAAGTYITLFSRSGTGLFFGCQAAFNNGKCRVRVTIDGGQVFDLILDDVRQFQFNDTTTTRIQMGGFLTTVGNVFDFSSRFAIPYETTILVEAATSDASNHNNTNWMVILTEDT